MIAIWTENFFVFGAIAAFTAFILMWAMRFRRRNNFVAFLIRLFVGIGAMLFFGTALSLLALAFDHNVIVAVLEDPIGAAAFSFEMGAELILFWFPIVFFGAVASLFRKRLEY